MSPTVPHGPLEGAEVHRWAVSREDDDVLSIEGERVPVLRASIGGNEAIGYYLVFRGDPEAIAKMLDMAREVARAVAEGRQSVKDKRRRRSEDR